MTTYTVCSAADLRIAKRGLTAREAATTLMTAGGLAHEIRPDLESGGWRLWYGAVHMSPAIFFSRHPQQDRAAEEIYQRIAEAGLPVGGWEVMCDTDDDETMDFLASDES